MKLVIFCCSKSELHDTAFKYKALNHLDCSGAVQATIKHLSGTVKNTVYTKRCHAACTNHQ